RPILSDLIAQPATTSEPSEIIDCDSLVTPRPRLSTVLFDQLQLLRQLAGPVDRLQVVERSNQGYTVQGVLASGVGVDLTATVCASQPPTVCVRLVRDHDGFQLDVPHFGS